jgi:predicted ATPase/class 3 adenylate cyclase
MGDRPSGTVTFLFSDIEASTRLLRDIGAERYGEVLDDHRRLIRAAIAEANGFEVDTQGDAFFVAFHRPDEAVRAAVTAQRGLAAHEWPDGQAVRVRMGIHTAEAIPTSEGYVGLGVHHGARICAAGHGGQVLVSAATAAIMGEDQRSLGLVDLGVQRLKDMAEPEHLFQVVADGLGERFPPLRTIDNRATNLPVQATPLVGRQRELTDIVGALRRPGVRVVTLTGAGGSGKTRLAIEAGGELLDDHADGVFFVALATITEPSLVLPAIAEALGISEAAGQSLTGYLAPKQILLVIDNVEQVIEAASDIAGLLTAAPPLQMLVTSREPLHIAAEHVLPVEPMASADAVSLFVERAAAALPSFQLTADNRPAIEAICARLDGLPLAIELAAVRITVLSPEAMLVRLSDRLNLLTGGARDLPARHRTLRATLAWSHDLLTDKERDLFAGCAVFAGGFSLEAAEEVCGTDLDVLGSLVDRSLIRRTGERYEMLATVREFALERLAERTEGDAVRGRHAAHFEALVQHAFEERHRNQWAMADRLTLDHDDIREALDWLRRTDPLRYVRLVGHLGWFWHAHSHFTEGRERVSDALPSAPPGGEDRARLLSAAVELAAWQGDADAAERFGTEAIAAWRAIGPQTEMDVALTFYDLGWGHFFGGDDERARLRLEESLAIHQRLGDPLLTNRAQLGLLQVLVSLGDTESVKRLAPEALAISQSLRDGWSEHFAHHFLGDCAVIEGDVAEAEKRYRLSLEAAWQSGDQAESSVELQGMAMAAAGKGNAVRALRLAGAADATLRGRLGVLHMPPFWTALVDRHVALAREHLGPTDADAAWTAGTRLSLQSAVDEALDSHSSASLDLARDA